MEPVFFHPGCLICTSDMAAGRCSIASVLRLISIVCHFVPIWPSR